MTSLYHQCYQIGKNTHDRPCDQHKDQDTGDSLFEVGILPEKVPRVEQEPDKEDDPQDDGEDSTDGVRDIGHRILDAPDLGL